MKAKAKFYLEKRKDVTTGEIRTKNVPIIMHLNFNGKRLQHYTGERIDAEHWQDTKTFKDGTVEKVQRVKRNIPGSMEINETLNTLASEVEKIHRNLKIQGITTTVKVLRKFLKENLNGGQTTVVRWLLKQNKQLEKELKVAKLNTSIIQK